MIIVIIKLKTTSVYMAGFVESLLSSHQYWVLEFECMHTRHKIISYIIIIM